MEPTIPTPDALASLLRFGAALGLGVLLGLEREHSHPTEGFAGVRTFGLLALAGGVAAYLATVLGQPWLAVAVFAAAAGLVVVSYAVTARLGDVGVTTEVSALLAFLLGFLCVGGHVLTAAVLAVASGSVLALKDWLHRLAGRIETADIAATLKFAIVSVIILPLVPDQNFGPPPLAVINPFKIWLMVVLISGLNFASYLLVKLVGAEHGIGLTGLLGGLVSSTAVTLGFAQRSRHEPQLASSLALGILVAWSVMFVRVGVLIAAVNRELLPHLWLPLAAFALAGAAICLVLRRKLQAAAKGTVAAGANPFELGEAVRFGLLFGAITFAAKAAQVYLGDAGLFLAAGLAGLTDVDAITLSMAQLAQADPAKAGPAAAAVVVALIANTLVKTGMAGTLGAPSLRRFMVPAGAMILAAGALAVWLG
jgi:uncharacterized membrane protein (DUF4010 family)